MDEPPLATRALPRSLPVVQQGRVPKAPSSAGTLEDERPFVSLPCLGPRYWLWGVAHLACWGDKKFYKIMADRFL